MWLFLIGLLGPPAHAQSCVEGLEGVLDEIQGRFPQSVSGDALYKAALDGVAAHLGEELGSTGNRVLSKADYEDTKAWLDGRRYGIGAEFSVVSGRGLQLTEVFDDSPADQSGLVAGDLIVTVDAHPLTGLSTNAILDRVQRQKHARSVFDVLHSDGSVGRMEVQRGPYQLATVRIRQEKDALVIRMPFFGSGAASQMRRALQEWDGSAVVLDLRDNGGGSMDEMVACADLFLDPDAVVVETSNGSDYVHTLSGTGDAAWTTEVVIIVNKGTAGVAEAFVAALQDHGRAQVVGTHTSGRGLQTSFYPAGRGLVLEIADTWLRSPSGRSWHGAGIVPNVFVEAQQLSLPASSKPDLLDLQRDAAIRLMTSGAGEQ